MRLKQYYQLWKFARARLESETHYRAFQAFQARLLLDYFRQHHVEISGKLLVDLGSGIGGYSQEYARNGAKVINIDLTQPHHMVGLAVNAICGNALYVPLASNSVDFVVCASLIEHVAEPDELIAEIERILKPEGYCYLSFPPFFSPVGGHEFAPFHYFGERIALKLKKRENLVPDWVAELYEVPPNPESFSDLYQGWGLYKMTIGKARRLLALSNLTVLDISTRYMPVSFVKWPILGELLTWHTQFLLKKTDNR